MIYYFAYEGKVYETTLQVVVDGCCGTSRLYCVEYDTRALVTLHPNSVMDGECKFHRDPSVELAYADAQWQRQDEAI